MPQLFIIKICFTIKVNSICGAGQDTRNMCHKFNSQGPALRILDLRVVNSKYQGPSSGIVGIRVPVLGSWVSGPCVLGSQSPRSQIPRVPGPGSQGPRVSSLSVLWSWISGPQGPGSQSPRVLGPRVPESQGLRVPGLRVSRSQGPGFQGLRISSRGSQVLILDYGYKLLYF